MTGNEKEIVVKGTLGELWDVLKRKRQQWEDHQAPVMLAGPFHEAGNINCLIKPVKDAARRLPDELHFGTIRAIPGERIRVVFRQHNFPDPVALFWQAVDELVEAMKEEGLEPQTPMPSEAEADETKKPRVPGRPADLIRWKAAWGKIKGMWQQGRSYKVIADWLRNTQPEELHYSAETVPDIIKAGEAGLLDNQ